uniref:Oxygen evolving protein of photosystem ii n=1 Tax=Tetraselmis sp. GSL018 TaxID=582737 RepID=A0A061RYH5_9CHLO
MAAANTSTACVGTSRSRLSRATQTLKPVRRQVARREVSCSVSNVFDNAKEAAGKLAAGLMASAVLAGGLQPAAAITYKELQGLTYLQVKGTGVASTCPVITGSSTTASDLAPGEYSVQNFCLEPTSFNIRDESQKRPEFVKTTLLTRLTYTLDNMTGKMTIGKDGTVSFKEEDGMDYAAVTVSLPGGEPVPFLYTAREFDAKGTLESFSGDFTVPSYRGATFMDPKGRGASTGYDTAIALQTRSDADELEKENNKNVQPMRGSMVMSIVNADADTGEISGVFEALQPTDTDMGAKPPKDLKITGVWYAQLDRA